MQMVMKYDHQRQYLENIRRHGSSLTQKVVNQDSANSFTEHQLISVLIFSTI